jgi:hypothetical protein
MRLYAAVDARGRWSLLRGWICDVPYWLFFSFFLVGLWVDMNETP